MNVEVHEFVWTTEKVTRHGLDPRDNCVVFLVSYPYRSNSAVSNINSVRMLSQFPSTMYTFAMIFESGMVKFPIEHRHDFCRNFFYPHPPSNADP